MSHHDYEMSLKISAEDPPFYALLMACFRKAGTYNTRRLRSLFPTVWAEYNERYHSPGGLIGNELLDKVVSELPETLLGRKVTVFAACPTKFIITLGDYDIEGWLKDREEPDESA